MYRAVIVQSSLGLGFTVRKKNYMDHYQTGGIWNMKLSIGTIYFECKIAI